MKKYVIGIIIGAILMFSGQALADSISKVGKRVQAEYLIKVDGKTLEAKALAIDGQTTTPNRALADAVGYDVVFINKEVIFTKRTEVQSMEDTEQPAPTEPVIEIPATSSPEPVEVPKPEYTLESITKLIASKESALHISTMGLNMAKAEGVDPKKISELEVGIREKEVEIEQLKAIKAELETKK